MILAALAADALPGLRFVHIQDVSDPDADLVTALLTTADGQQVILKSPKSQIALTHLGLEVRALRILRNVELPFRIPSLLGETSNSAVYKALAFDYITGTQVNFDRLKLEDPMVVSIGQTLAQIHSIPTDLVASAGLPEYDPALRNRERVAEFDRAMETGKINPALLERWQNALLDVNLFRYQPTTVHGAMSDDVLLRDGDAIVGINNWSKLAVDDPAVDIAAIYGNCNSDLANAIVLAYEGSTRADRNLKQRANLYFELSLANYLLQCLDQGDEEYIAESVRMLDALHQDLVNGLLPSLAPTEFAATEVVTPISQAASFTSPIAVVTEQIEVLEEPKPKEEN